MTSWCASNDLETDGQGGICRKHSIINPRCPEYSTAQSYNSTPYSVVLSDKSKPNVNIDFQPQELVAVSLAVTQLFKSNLKN